MQKSTIVKKLILLSLVVLVGQFGWLVSRSYMDNKRCCATNGGSNVLFSVMEVLNIIRFRSQVGQDRWIVQSVYPGITDGYFVDVGSGSGVLHSNSKVLESLGWRGICIDPFPKDMDGRDCMLFENVVARESGKSISFRKAGALGGIEEHLGRWKAHPAVNQSDMVEFQTVSLNDILKRGNAPGFIHYMSLDIEGAELEALQGFDFSRYRVGALTIEHNFEEPKRSQIRALLESHGYKLERTIEQDDCYVSAQPASGVR